MSLTISRTWLQNGTAGILKEWVGGSPGSRNSLGFSQVASLEDHGASQGIGLAVNICHFYLAHGSISIGLLSDFAVR